MDFETTHVQPQSALHANKKLKLKQKMVAECDVMDIEDGEHPSEVLIDNANQHIKDVPNGFLGNSASLEGSSDSGVQLKGSTSGSISSKNINNSSNSDLTHDDEDLGDDDMDYIHDDDDDSNYDNDEYLYGDDDDEDDYLKIQSQFDDKDLPSGVEVSLPWLQEPALSAKGSSASSSNVPSGSSSGSNSKASGVDDAETKRETTSGPSTENKSQAASVPTPILEKYKNFKQFDTVEDFSDHHYKGTDFTEQSAPKSWAKRIQEEWKILEKDLPDTIFVRVYESRMELLRALIVGPQGTPYHDGLFVFDCLFPANYPDSPPTVYYYSGGLRLNPNLYECGKVCLSLLGTWSGQETEKWIKGKSTMLQVLVSIQALILNARPFFNEPGYESSYTGDIGNRRSNEYSENVFILSLKTMIYTLRRPPKHFEDFVIGHFHSRACDILVACNEYTKGATVACVSVQNGEAHVKACDKNGSTGFRASVKKMINILITTFSKFGSIECEQFRVTA